MNTIEYIKSVTARNDLVELLNKVCTGPEITSEYFKPPKLLYRYSSLNCYALDNLINNTLTLTAPAEFNDLYDSTMHFNSIPRQQDDILEINRLAKELNIKEVLNDDMKETLLNQSEEVDRFRMTNITSDFRIACLSSGFKDIKMWSHYGNRSRGICIEYNIEKFNNGLGKCLYPVTYLQEPLEVTDICETDGEFDLAALVSVITKSIGWQDENEWRIVWYLNRINNKYVPAINIPRRERIFLGYKFMDYYLQALEENLPDLTLIKKFLEYVKSSGSKLKVMRPQIGKYDLEDEDIDVEEILRS